MKSWRKYGYWVLALSAALLLAGGALAPTVLQADTPSPGQVVQRAWRLAQHSGQYHFATRIVQTTHPAPTLANVGAGSRAESVYLEGEADLPAQTLLLRLWSNGGRVTSASSGVEVRVEGDQTRARVIGGDWQEMDDFAGTFAPGNNPTAFLAAARNIRQVNAPSSSVSYASRFTHYAFTLHAPTLADYIRDQLEEHLRTTGELPAGIHLDTPEAFRNAVGGGEVWVDGDGLPLRLTIHMEYPQGSDGERVEADIQTDFYGFAPPVQATNPVVRLAASLGLPRTPQAWLQIAQQSALAAGSLGLLLALAVYARSKKVYATFVLALIFSMVVTPLLQSHQVYAFAQRQAARQAEYEQRRQEQEAARQTEETLYGSDWDPHLEPGIQYSATGDPSPIRNTQYATRNTTSMLQSSEATPDPDSDDDGDGLPYVQEDRLGTDPDEKDTDADLITDDVEVAGFRYNSLTWYTNPLTPDTNNDGLMDGLECPERARENENSLSPAGVCRDLDGDGTPDVFDRDNDGDGVPDLVDVSPFDKMGQTSPFTAENPLLLQVDDLQANEPAFVDLQLRPTDPDHLWYALNVLDWPSGDEHGQVQRKSGNDSTFADVESQPADNAGNGDMRLVPMLEILIPYKDGHYGNLPVRDDAPITRTQDMTVGQWLDTSRLDPYGISVRDMNDDGDLAVYVPVNLVADEYGSDRVAFSARMLYWPAGSDWGNTQQVRLVWAVQMLTDFCQPQESGPCEWETDHVQFVHAYPDAWYLSGLNVQEDHGLDVAIVYEDPSRESSDAARQYDDWLWALAHGLDFTFLNGRDCEPLDAEGNCQGDGQRDVTTDEIYRRWDNRVNGGTTDDERWGIPITATQVVTFSYEHEGYSAYIAITETHKILSDTFTAYVNQGSDAPTLLFTAESHYRAANLGDSDAVTRSGNRLTIRLDPEKSPLTTRASMHWAPYRYEDDEWQSYPIGEYWDKMAVRFKEVFTEYKDDPDFEDIRQGQVFLARMAYLSLYRGYGEVVQIGNDITGYRASEQTDAELKKFLKDVEEGGGGIVWQIATLADRFTVIMGQMGVIALFYLALP